MQHPGGAVAQLGARLDGIEEVVGSNPIGSTKSSPTIPTMSYAEIGAPIVAGMSKEFSRFDEWGGAYVEILHLP